MIVMPMGPLPSPAEEAAPVGAGFPPTFLSAAKNQTTNRQENSNPKNDQKDFHGN
jgi:hypothetical protein